MRTTLSIDEDLLLRLKKAAHRSGLPLQQVVNSALRRGLDLLENERLRHPHRCPTFSMGSPSRGLDLDKALDIAVALDGDEPAREPEFGASASTTGAAVGDRLRREPDDRRSSGSAGDRRRL
jgi:hypothetical protein